MGQRFSGSNQYALLALLLLLLASAQCSSSCTFCTSLKKNTQQHAPSCTFYSLVYRPQHALKAVQVRFAFPTNMLPILHASFHKATHKPLLKEKNSPAVHELGSWCHLGPRTLKMYFWVLNLPLGVI
jgi:hypothetical protein